MHLNRIQPKNQTEDLLLSKIRSFERLFKQTLAKAQETLKLEINKARETFSFKPPISIKASCMVRLKAWKYVIPFSI